jgi:ATP-binding cassette, subfamily C, bacterial exporter for protease/lipase
LSILDKVVEHPQRLKALFGVVAGLSIAINLFALVQPLFMLHVYDYVLSSGSLPTLGYLTLIAVFLIGLQGVVDFGRTSLLNDASEELDEQVRAKLLTATLAQRYRTGDAGRAGFTRHLDTIKAFLSGPSAVSLIDLPWTPLFIIVLWLLSPWLALLVVIFALIVFGVTVWGERRIRDGVLDANTRNQEASAFVGDVVANGDASLAMGFAGALIQKWERMARESVRRATITAILAGQSGAAVKALRVLLQVLVLAAAAWLVLLDQLSAGAMIAASIIAARALAPIDMVVGAWRQVLAAREAWAALGVLAPLAEGFDPPHLAPLQPSGALSLEGASLVVGPQKRAVVRGVSMAIPSGSFVGLVGASGSGKSSLMRLMVGAVAPSQGSVRLDDLELDQHPRALLGSWIGYLPQNTQLISGSVADNIRRFGAGTDEEVILAARAVGADRIIARLSDGYDTDIGPSGAALSGGEQALIGLARALFGNPSLIVLDEPFAHLDAEAGQQVWRALRLLRKEKRTLVMATHRPRDLTGFDLAGALVDGRLVRFGPVAEVLAELVGQPTSTKPDMKVVS